MTNTDTKTAPAQWQTLAAAELTAHPGNQREGVEVPAEFLADVAANGVQEPLYVFMTRGGVPQVVDGFVRLAAAVASGTETVPVTFRPVIRIDALTPHPKNARADLDINTTFVESLRAEGCRIPVKVQRLDGGVIQINDGNRRYFGARDAGLTHLPYEWEDEEQSEAGQFLDMITTAQQRKGLTAEEVQGAMFSAAEAGAPVARIAKAAGVRQKDVKAVMKVNGNEELREAVASASGYEWSFEHLAAIQEFAGDEAALAEITEAAAEDGDPRDVEWAISRERTKRDKRAKVEARRAELEEAGHQIRDIAELADHATPVWRLRTTEDQRISREDHAECKGQVWLLDERGNDGYEPWCTSPVLYGHAAPGDNSARSGATAADQEAAKAARALVKRGNIDWDASEAVRRQWITELIKRRTLPKTTATAITQHVTHSLLQGGWVVSEELRKQRTTEVLTELLGLSSEQANRRDKFPELVAKDPRRAAQQQFAAVAACREGVSTRAAWRTDEQRVGERRQVAREWFQVLESLGYRPTPIERSVINDEPYDPDKNPAEDAAPDDETEDAASAAA
ncbi:chromosome partitioning protein ParB [Streptomyces sp. NPDC051561]|uniref:chromosome partitioning protein ParB n=1 Tax=Streptomyces sp. NPDC051561 TaxID=3365658 RepID=UPI0037B9D08D